MWEEANHFMTFEYIIETFPFNREEIYAAGWGKKSLTDPRPGGSSPGAWRTGPGPTTSRRWDLLM